MRDQLLGTLQRLARKLPLRLGLGDLRLQLGVVDFEERRAIGDLLPFPHQDVGDASRDFGAQLDRLDRFDLAGCRDRVDDGVADGGRDFDGHGEAARSTGASPSRGVGLFARGQSREQEQNS